MLRINRRLNFNEQKLFNAFYIKFVLQINNILLNYIVII